MKCIAVYDENNAIIVKYEIADEMLQENIAKEVLNYAKDFLNHPQLYPSYIKKRYVKLFVGEVEFKDPIYIVTAVEK